MEKENIQKELDRLASVQDDLFNELTALFEQGSKTESIEEIRNIISVSSQLTNQFNQNSANMVHLNYLLKQ